MPEPDWIVWIEQLTERDLPHAGGKAVALGRLCAMGMPVPRGFVVTTAAYRAFVAGDGTMPDAIAAAVRNFHRAMGHPRVAVRSSATIEDQPDASFAGQGESYLDVDADALPARVRDCWLSLQTARAVAYRRERGIADAEMAVVVQTFIPADAAGVCFTVDPRTGAARVVLEAVTGTGDALVSGLAAPERVYIDRARRRIDGTTTCLTARQVRTLADLALRIECRFGGPQDVEWARRGRRLFLLQARPITALPPTPVVWSNVNVGELMPEVATPMSWSVLNQFLEMLIGPALRRMGIQEEGISFVGLVAGRVYANMSVFVRMFAAMPGPAPMNVDTVFGGYQGDRAAVEALLAVPPVPWWRKVQAGWRVAHTVADMVVRALRTSPEEVVAAMRAYIDTVVARDLATFDDAALLALITHPAGIGADDPTLFSQAGMGMAMTNGFITCCRRWLGDDGSLANRLLAGAGGMDSAAAGQLFWRLAAGAPLEVAAVLREALDFTAVEARLRETADGRAFLAAWEAELARHGHHARAELDVARPRWAEQSDYVLDMVRAQLDMLPTLDWAATQRQRAAERDALLAASLRTLNPLRRAIFRGVLARAQRGLAMRENLKSEGIRLLAAERRALRELATRLATRGILQEADDIFFLYLEELPDALRGTLPDLAARKAAHAYHGTLNPPPVVVGAYRPEDDLPPPPLGARELRGLPVCPGVTEGPARVILNIDTHTVVQPGEILVAPFTDPGWTPYFLPAAAIVVDMGGLLSHGSIVAREYGIPAVVNVGPATRLITTGQRLRVDGTRGVVTLLDT
jgi:pyruvate,water dikinase